MNDDRKFKERAELMKQLFLARISPDVIAKVAEISEATVSNDRARVAKMYGIKVPAAANSSNEKAERFRLLFNTYCKSTYKSSRDPMIKAANLTINIERIENCLYSMENLWNHLCMPCISSDYPFADNYMELLERCHSLKKRELVSKFYQAINDGIIPSDSFRYEKDVIAAATKFFTSNHRREINSYVIANPKEFFEPLLSILTERERAFLAYRYGLDCEKLDISEIGYKYGLSRERVRQVIEKAIRILSVRLNDGFAYSVSSSARIDNLEKENKKLEERYNKLADDTDIKLAKLKVENEIFRKKLDKFNLNVDPIPDIEYTAYVSFLTRSVKECYFTIRTSNILSAYNMNYLVDIVDNWNNLKTARLFGRKTKNEIIDFFEGSGIDMRDFNIEDIALAKRIIERMNL